MKNIEQLTTFKYSDDNQREYFSSKPIAECAGTSESGAPGVYELSMQCEEPGYWSKIIKTVIFARHSLNA